ncbi:MAG: hypothetical protein ABJD68_15005 [Nakamurella sp.]
MHLVTAYPAGFTTVLFSSHTEGVVSIDARPFIISVVVLAAIAGCTSFDAGSPGTASPSISSPPSRPVAPPRSTSAEVPTAASTIQPAGPTVTQQVVALAPGVADGASGIAASTGTPGAYYLVDDRTHTNHIVAVGTDGVVLADVQIEGMSASNAEALAGGPCGATPLRYGAPETSNCLFIGDIGDNNARRDDIAIFRIGEPDLSEPPTEPVPTDSWRYTYPDGPQNAESIMAAPDGSVVIVTKPAGGKEPSRMYRAEPGGGELVFLREFTPPDPQLRLKTLFTGNVVTDLAAAPGRVLLLTYDELTEYTAPDSAADITGFPDWPHHRLPMPALPQAEGIAAMVGGCGYVVASEAGPGGSNGALGVVSCG